MAAREISEAAIQASRPESGTQTREGVAEYQHHIDRNVKIISGVMNGKARGCRGQERMR